MDMVIKRFDVYIANLDPTEGSEINKSRPVLIISPDEMNKALNTVIVAPLTSTIRNYPTRIDCVVERRKGQIALDQIRTIDKKRLSKKLQSLDEVTTLTIIDTLTEMFS